MRFNPKARLDTGRVSDRGRGRGGGGGRLPIPGGLPVGGGIGGVLVVVLVVVATQLLGGGGGPPVGDGLDPGRLSGTGRYADCTSGADANSDVDCARVAVENSLYDYWSATFPAQAGDELRPERGVVTFTDSVDTRCGPASSATGPFYCPGDSTIYLDTTFFDDVLARELSGPSGDFVEPYVLAHEYGHHIQNLLGTMDRLSSVQGANSDSVRLELQADCYAGMWARSATSTDDATGHQLIQDLTAEDIEEAVSAAKAVGDDRIQKQSTGRVDREGWTHGSSAQRMRWFTTGYQQGTLDSCDTFSTSRL